MTHTWDLFNPTVTLLDGSTITGTIAAFYLDGNGRPCLLQLVKVDTTSVSITFDQIKYISHD